MVNANQLREKVFFHMFDGKDITRTMTSREIINANRIGRLNGEDARIEEYVRLFNEKYSAAQPKPQYVELNAEERRFFELHNMRSISPLTEEEEEEYQDLLDN